MAIFIFIFFLLLEIFFTILYFAPHFFFSYFYLITFYPFKENNNGLLKAQIFILKKLSLHYINKFLTWKITLG